MLPNLVQNKLLKEVSTIGIGGPAKLFSVVQSIEQMQMVLHYCKSHSIPYIVIGKGSNCLFSDLGFDGMVIQNRIDHLKIEGANVTVGAGYSFSLLGVKTAKLGLSGLEFACGIPASVGGAVFMNAGANGFETSDCLDRVAFMTEEGAREDFAKQDLDFAYRFSSFHEKKGAIVEAMFCLHDKSSAREFQQSILSYRLRTQPYQDKSAGCIFRNPQIGPCGALIEKIGLKGVRVGGAQVSHMHANFIVNKENATAQDVLELIGSIKEKVLMETGVKLEVEIRCIPYTHP